MQYPELFMGQENYVFILRYCYYLSNLPKNSETIVQQLQDHS